MTPDDLVAALRPHIQDALIATDFDGTLAPLSADPEASRPVGGTLAALIDLAGRGAQVAVITGRDARTVVRLGGLEAIPHVVVEGLYGLEQWRDGELTTPDVPDEIERLRERLPGVLRDAGTDPQVWIEDKRLSLVVHARRTENPDAELARLRPGVERLAGELGLEAHPGSQVLELRLPGYDKAGAVDRLLAHFPARAVLFAGDDVGDLPAMARMRHLRENGTPAWAVGVLSSGVDEIRRAADVVLDDAAAVVALFRELAAG